MRRTVLATLVSLILVGIVGTTAAGAASPVPARVRFVHTVASAGPVDVAVIGGPVLVRDLSYPQSSPYISVAPGTYNIELLAAGTQTVLVRIMGWTAVSGVSTTVQLVRGANGVLDVSPMTDPPTASLPLTGASTGKVVLAALGLIGLGAVLCTMASSWARRAAVLAGGSPPSAKALP